MDAIASLQPYNHPDGAEHHMLGLLRWLSNTDKHRVIHTMAASAVDADPDSAGFRLIKGSGQLDKAQIRGGALLAEGEPVLRARLDPQDPAAEAEWYGQFDARPVFGDRRATDAGIQQLQGVVTTIVEPFAPDFGEQHS